MQERVVAGRYELERVLGQGTTGAVWLARDRVGGNCIALKIASAEVAVHPAARDRFLREAKLAADLVGPHLVRVHDHGLTEQGAPFVAMEYVDGTNLAEELAARRRLSLDETLHVVSGVCAGLAVAHRGGIVHRDVKPQNILVARAVDEPRDEDDDLLGTVKVSDFGCAKAADWLAGPYVDPTRTGDLVGTPCYMSPEQAMGRTAIDARADLWSVGVVAFECATGVRAFEAAALGPLVTKILTGPIPVPSRAAPEAALPREFDAWMARMLVRDPAARHASAEEVADSLAAALDAVAGARTALGAPDESTIRERAAAGDVASAAGATIGQFGGEILRYLYAVLRDEDLANEAFSAFCERLLIALPRFQWRCSARTWAYTLARRSAADAVRAERRRRRWLEPLTESRVEVAVQQVRSATWPLLRTERRSALLQLSDDLPPDDRMLLILRVDRGLAWQDVARVFLQDEAANDGVVRREAARLRKRFQLIRERLQDRARAKGLALESLEMG
jgi:eukaryotic-like serine/threonine-protein kinase